ncbi:MAG: molybdopterin biosynthesis protein [Desulfobacterales bacterium]|nr:molybdopterin biosynthesis protein [Desulfobacterales bacterium]
MNTHRNIYLKMKSLNDARNIVFKRFQPSDDPPTETISVPEAVGRVLAEPVSAKISSPHFHAAAMDGIAVRAESTFGASTASPKELIVGKDAFYVNTGHVIPENTDAVIMIEHIHVLDENRIEIEAPVYPWQHVRRIGEDIVATELLFPRSHFITPYCVGALLTAGIFSVTVRKKPKILIIPTGSELVDWRNIELKNLKPGQVIEINSLVLGKLVEACGGTYHRHAIIADDLEKIEQAVAEAVSNDFQIIMTIGGSSAGSEDYVKAVVSNLGQVLVHGVTIMPGKPVLIGAVKNTPVFGIPGYPVSAIIAFEQFVRPLIYMLTGLPDHQQDKIEVEPTRKIASKLGVEEFLRVKLGKVEDRVVATPLPRGAGCITSITEADGIIRIPSQTEGLNAHDPVSAELLRPLPWIDNTIVVVGSHDNTLDILADQVRAKYNRMTLSSSHVGSMGALMAIKKGVCHLGGCHLLDPSDGSYNITYIKKYLPNVRLKVVNLVFRQQGLIIPPGNPKQIKGFKDLLRNDISFINRQIGSGTRILLDYHLQKLHLDPVHINGYRNEEFTHMAIAVAVLSGSVDTGLAICAAAKALNLEFIPVATEQYDLIIPEKHFESENIQLLLKIINSTEFKNHVKNLGGYDTQKTGEMVWAQV